MTTKYYLVMGEVGEYSSREVWAVALFETEEEAQAFAEAASAEGRAYYDTYRKWLEEVRWPWSKAKYQEFGGYGYDNSGAPEFPGFELKYDSEHVGCFWDDPGNYWVEEVEVKKFP